MTGFLARLKDRRILMPAILALVYLVYYGAILIKSGGIPYVMDGNESFSTLWHAYNLFHFKFADSFGLTDEAISTGAAAHPFLHTHQGNLPRLFGFLIYALGARTIESQVVVTTAAIGTLTLVFAYGAMARLAGRVFAFIFCLVLFTDYILYAQWHVVTYRVWYGFLFFAILLAIQRADGRRRWLAQAGLFGGYLLLFYGELVFAGLMAVTGASWTLWTYRRKARLALRLILIEAAGAALSVGILFLQLWAKFGLHVVAEDFRLTFLARNLIAAPHLREAADQFYNDKPIVFLSDFGEGSPPRSLWSFLRLQTSLLFQVHTPILALICLMLLGGWAVGWLFDRRGTGWRAAAASRAQIAMIAVPSLLLALFSAAATTSLLPSGRLAPVAAKLLALALGLVAGICLRELAGTATAPGGAARGSGVKPRWVMGLAMAAAALLPGLGVLAASGLPLGSARWGLTLLPCALLAALCGIVSVGPRRTLPWLARRAQRLSDSFSLSGAGGRDWPWMAVPACLAAVCFLLLYPGLVHPRLERGLLSSAAFVLTLCWYASARREAAALWSAALAAGSRLRGEQAGQGPGPLSAALLGAGAVVLWTVGLALLLAVLAQGPLPFGLKPTQPVSASLWLMGLALAVAASGGIWLWREATERTRDPQPTLSLQMLLCAVFLWFVYFVIRGQWHAYDQDFSLVWMMPLGFSGGTVFARAVAVLALAVAIGLALGGPRRLLGAVASREIARALGFFIVCEAAFAVIYWLSPGYIYKGYLERYAPFAVFFVELPLAAALFALYRTVSAPWLRRREARAPAVALPLPLLRGGAAAVLTAIGLYWIVVQGVYAALLPPDHAAFLKLLREPQFAGKSVAVNTYAAPMAAMTGGWGYFDDVLAQDHVIWRGGGYDLARNLRTALWFADRHTNPAYLRPDYYVCFWPQSFRTAVGARDPSLFQDLIHYCPSLGIVSDATKPGFPLHRRLVAADPSLYASWAIVKLGWTFPPFVRSLALTVEAGTAGAVAQVSSETAQQDGIPVIPADVELLAERGNAGCVVHDNALTPIGRLAGSGALPLPPGFSGLVVARVTPRTADARGIPVLSNAVSVTSLLDSTGSGTVAAVRIFKCSGVRELDFRAVGDADKFETAGWAAAESWGTWTVGRTAELVVPNPSSADSDMVLTMEVRGLVNEAHPVASAAIEAQGITVGRIVLAPGNSAAVERFRVPRMPMASGNIDIKVENDDPVAPARALPDSPDERLLGLGFTKLSLAAASAADVAIVPLGQSVGFAAGQAGTAMLASGWSTPESWGTWGLGNDSILLFKGGWKGTPVRLALDARAYLPPDAPPLSTEVLVNGAVVGRLDFAADQERVHADFAIPAEVVGDSAVAEIEFRSNRPSSFARTAAAGAEVRPLALGLVALTILEKQ